MSAGIFISYRRNDTASFVQRLQLPLKTTFGRETIFVDVDKIHAGDHFPTVINSYLASCKLMLVLVGRSWLQPSREGRTLHHQDDFVRIEIMTALKRGVYVQPVLLDGAIFPPKSSIPVELHALTERQALKIRSDMWSTDVQELLRLIHQNLYPAAKTPEPTCEIRSDGIYLCKIGDIHSKELQYNYLRFRDDEYVVTCVSSEEPEVIAPKMVPDIGMFWNGEGTGVVTYNDNKKFKIEFTGGLRYKGLVKPDHLIIGPDSWWSKPTDVMIFHPIAGL